MTTDAFDARAATYLALPVIKACASLRGFLTAGNALPIVEPSWSVRSVPAVRVGSSLFRGRSSRNRATSASRLTPRDHAAWLSILHPDDRLSYLSNIGFSDEEVEKAAEVVEQWLDVHWLNSLDECSKRANEIGEGIDWVIDKWERTGPYDALARLVQSSSISQPEPVICYAVCSAIELALSMLILHELDTDAEPVSGGPDAQWAEEDEFIASLDLFETVSRWPE